MSTFRRPFTIIKRSPPKRVGPRFESSGTVTESVIMASLQPDDGKEMQSLPEGRRFSEFYNMFTSSNVETVTAGGANPDIVLVDGEEFEVVKVAPWKNNVINHYKLFVAKCIEPSGSPYVPLPPPVAGQRITAAGDARITADGNNRVIASA